MAWRMSWMGSGERRPEAVYDEDDTWQGGRNWDCKTRRLAWSYSGCEKVVGDVVSR